MFTKVLCQDAVGQEVMTVPAARQDEQSRNLRSYSGEQDLSSRRQRGQASESRITRAAQLETALVQSAMDGDLSAFNQLVLMHQNSLYGWILSLVRDEAVAEDITQTTFISAYGKLKTFRGGSFRAWLFVIARNRSFDELRRIKRYPQLSLDEPSSEDTDHLEILPSAEQLPEEVLLSTEQAAVIEELLNRLPDAFQQVLRLVDMEGMDYLEAAQVLSLPLGTVKSRLTRARLKMRGMFQAARWLR